jgi:hypothetical protein
MNVRWIVELTDDERAALRQFTSGYGTKACKIKRALILLPADNGMSDADIADVATRTRSFNLPTWATVERMEDRVIYCK